MSELRRTPLHDSHVRLGARMVEFAGYSMPVQYERGIQEEVKTVRNGCGIFDLCHMGRLILRGAQAIPAADHVLSQNVAKIPEGAIRYALLCAEDGTVIDDTLVYRENDEAIHIVINASGREVDDAWIREKLSAFDVTIENVSDELTVKNQELIELQQMKEDFTAMIVHDMRSPLMIVQGVLDLLYYKHRTKPDERELIEDGIGVTKKMLQLVSNLLETSKIEAGELHLQREEVELSQFLRESVEPFNVVARAHEIDLETDVAEDLPTIRADRGCLGQVIDNLLSNAFKFSPDGGRIVVSGEVIEPNRDRVRLVVEDTGAGIATADLAKIFKKFRQGRTGGRKGTGLGLTIVELLVNAHHGTVRVESEVGKGSRFIVELPIDGGEGADEGRPNAQNQLRP